MATRKGNDGAAEPGTAIGNQGSGGGPGGGPAAKGTEGGGQKGSQERGVATRSKKNPGKRPKQGGNAR